MELWSSFQTWFWNPDVWLPPNFDWADMKRTDSGIKYAEFADLIYPIPLAIGLIFIRFIVEKLILYPFGEKLGLPSKPRRKVKPHPILEKAYKSNPKSNYKELEIVAKRADLGVRQVERWMRRRTNMDKPLTISKFAESGWKFICYTINVCVGIWVLWDKSWFWDINYCWYDYPHHSITPDVWWYYMFGSSFYWSLMISQFFDRQRKDFWQMFVHHLTTVALLGFSWTCNFTRIGTLMLLLHDCADALLEPGKMTKYAELDKICDVIFGLFTIVWIVTRLGIYPVYILNSTLFEAPKIVPMFPAYYIFNAMLSILLVLHCFWTYFICRIAFKALAIGKVPDDERSSSDTVTELDTTSEAEELDNEKDNLETYHQNGVGIKKISKQSNNYTSEKLKD